MGGGFRNKNWTGYREWVDLKRARLMIDLGRKGFLGRWQETPNIGVLD